MRCMIHLLWLLSKQEEDDMKKIVASILICIMLFVFSSCGEKSAANAELDFSEIKSICNIATLECYYHNVAEGIKTKGTGALHLLEQDQKCWIEYTGTVLLGVDGEKVQVKVDGNNITITIPQAKVIRLGYDESENFIVYTSKQLIPLNKITEDEKTDWLKEGQAEMLEVAQNNNVLLNSAQKRAKEIITDYIEQVGAVTNRTYNIIWEEIE